MSWVEYNDMFERAQEKGEYHLFVFDLKGSRSIGYFIPWDYEQGDSPKEIEEDDFCSNAIKGEGK